jgi:Rps23 Pro-64 3,4-dihydroxylase Tpa1-like proline 4-hydroxylase
MNRQEYADKIFQRISSCKASLQRDFFGSDKINNFIVDNLLSEDEAREIYNAFPRKEEMVPANSLRGCKYIAVQMNRYNPLLEEIIYAFQEPKIVSLIAEITKIEQLLPDASLYGGGISLMTQGSFLNPHLDNSHDKERQNYRVLNALYYVTPEWKPEYGGNLELWPYGLKAKQQTIWSQFNRLVVMVTNKTSLHSVSPVLANAHRCCVSNYYFSPKSIEDKDYSHVASFRGRPEEKVKDVILQADAGLRNLVRRGLPKVVIDNSFRYKK